MQYTQPTLFGRSQQVVKKAFPPKQPGRFVTIKELPETERPINRLHRYGPAALSTTELVAVMLGHQRQIEAGALLMATFETLASIDRASTTELQAQPGLGHTTAARLKASFELGRRLVSERQPDRMQIRSPADAANLVMAEMMVLEQEHLRTIMLDTKNRVLAIPTIYVGSLNTSLIRVGELFKYAIRQNTASIIVVHNHPSGDPTPSPEDVAVTRQIVEAGKLLDIELMDHLIIGHNRFVSLKERGLGF